MEHKEPKALQPNSTHRRGQVKHSPEGRRRRLLFNPLVAQLLNPFPILAPEPPALRALLLLIIWWIFNWFFAHSMAANNKSYNILWPHLHLHSVDMKCATFTLPIHAKFHICMYVCEGKNVHRCILLVALLYLNKSPATLLLRCIVAFLL